MSLPTLQLSGDLQPLLGPEHRLMETALTLPYPSTHTNSHRLIQTFPSELLLIIFKFVYVAARREAILRHFPCSKDACVAEEKCYCDMESSRECDEYSDDRHTPLTLFPNSIASVCPRWGDLMLLVPVFWTRIVVLLDAEVFSPSNIKHQLSACASRNRAFDVIVTRTSFSDAVGLQDVEGSRMRQTIAALRSHFHRCRTLLIRVIYSSSLPSLLAVLPPDMPHLHTLSLESHIDSGRPQVQPYRLLDRAIPFSWSKLGTVVIDGWNFIDLHDHYPTPGQYTFSKCFSLCLKFGGEGFSSTSMRRLIEESLLEYLEVDSVALTGGGGTMDSRSPNIVTLKNLSAEATNAILYICSSPNRLTIDNCSLVSPTSAFGAMMLDLQNIGHGQGLGNCIQAWSGPILNVTGCPGFDDNVLKMMGVVHEEDDSWSQDLMQGLTIINCHGFSVDALKDLVDIRTSSPAGFYMLKWLGVERSGFPLSEEDSRWFREIISLFWWKS